MVSLKICVFGVLLYICVVYEVIWLFYYFIGVVIEWLVMIVY